MAASAGACTRVPGGAKRGKRTSKNAPPPGASVTRIVPRCSSRNSLTMASPRPVPPKRLVEPSSPLSEGFEDGLTHLQRHTRPVILDTEAGVSLFRTEPETDPAAIRHKFESIRKQIQENTLYLLSIDLSGD